MPKPAINRCPNLQSAGTKTCNLPTPGRRPLAGWQAAGIGERQATAIVSAMRQATGEHLATKADLEHLATKADLYKLAIGIVLANVGLTAGVIRLLL